MQLSHIACCRCNEPCNRQRPKHNLDGNKTDKQPYNDDHSHMATSLVRCGKSTVAMLLWSLYLVVPAPGLWVDGLANSAQNPQTLAAVLAHKLVTLGH